ncbi:hypothetical protein DRE_03878 [Drechslerella stenobrocha 248]|uniref:Rad4 beta-hairpin domain-containing protein n=1 Tax=Drechslerella stenobrocha 248 TaxID=1043628 RepID=W7HS10_9PEZI|nr:hypothetical protein DRE_03878 [Drechslerella stenobrocha 248]
MPGGYSGLLSNPLERSGAPAPTRLTRTSATSPARKPAAEKPKDSSLQPRLGVLDSKVSKRPGSTLDPSPLRMTAPTAPMQPATIVHARQIESESEDDSDDELDESDDEDEIEWENMDLSSIKPKRLKSNEPLVFELSASNAPPTSKKISRTGPTPVERRIRLEVHKLHLLCLLSHVWLRSRYCNDGIVQKHLLPILERRVVAELNDTSFDQAKVFRQGLSNAAAAFRRYFKVTRPGMRKALWGNIPSSPSALWGDIPIELAEFRQAGKDRTGSRDLGAQLFCALLRRVGLDVRLVCSLQPLSYLFKAKYSIDESKRQGTDLVEEDKNDYDTSEEDSSGDSGAVAGNVNKSFGGLGRANFRAAPVAPMRTGGASAAPLFKPSKKRKEKQIRIHDPILPVYWVEVFDVLNQSWIVIDPMDAGIVRSPDTLEPPQADAWENEMSYVVAFDNDSKARDITRKYVKAYNSYTRTLRVEATLNGDRWWRKAMRLFSVPSRLISDRDQVEDGLMANRVLREGIPKSLAAMKNHPVFALEEQLRQNEVIHPKVECGTMAAGKNKSLVPVYRRQDVKEVKTAMQWYMLGREVRAGEHPLKHKKRRRRVHARNAQDDSEDDAEQEPEEQDTGMYALFQTILYQPEPCLGPLVPKNAFGNIDLYVPSMLPASAVHIPHKLARLAANFLGIGSYVADAVTGFDFRAGGKSTPVITGIVAAEESEEAIRAMIEYIERDQEEEVAEKRRINSLNMWRKLLIALRIKERVDEYGLDSEGDATDLGEATDEEEEEWKEDLDRSRTVNADENEGPARDGPSELGSVVEPDEDDTGGGFFTAEVEDIAGETMKGSLKRKLYTENSDLLEQAKERRVRLVEIRDRDDDEWEVYDPRAFEGSAAGGGGFFTAEPISPGGWEHPLPKAGDQEAGDGADAYGGGFLAEDAVSPTENQNSPPASSLVGKAEALEQGLDGGGFIVSNDNESKGEQLSGVVPLAIHREDVRSKRKRDEDETVIFDGAERRRKERRKSIEDREEAFENVDEEEVEEAEEAGDDEFGFEYEEPGWASD